MADDDADVKIIVVDGVRYREEDAPKGSSDAGHKMRKPATKATSSGDSSK